MHKYCGNMVYKTRDELGEIEIVDDAVHRSLHFGSESKQSSMLLRDPVHLTLAYTRAMSTALLFTESHKRFLLIGLGGGSLAKFLLHYFPAAVIDAVEYRQAVLEVARSHFHLPEDNRLSIHIEDGGRFIHTADSERFGKYDAIFVDAFLGDGIAHSVCGMHFYHACRNRLAPGGILSINLWSGDIISARDIFEDLKESFSGNVLRLPVESKENIIALAGKDGKLSTQLRRIDARCKILEGLTGIEYTLLCRQLRKANLRLPFF